MEQITNTRKGFFFLGHVLAAATCEMVRIVARTDKKGSSSVDAPFIDYDERGKPYDVGLSIERNIEELIRFIANTMDYTLQDVYHMNIIEFFRDFGRAKKIVKKRKQTAEKWQTK